MALRNRWLVALGLVILSGLLLAGGALLGQRWLQTQGLLRLDWSGAQLSFSGLRLAQLQLDWRLAGLLQLQAEGLQLHWSWPGRQHAGLRQLQVRRLAAHWQPSDAAPTDEESFDLARLGQALAWLPARLRIDRLQVDLPCASGRCALLGAVQLHREQRAPLPARLQLELHRDAHRALLDLHLQGTAQALRLDGQLTLDRQPAAQVHSSLQRSADGQTWAGHLSTDERVDTTWLSAWLAQEWLPATNANQPAPHSLRLAADWRLQMPDGPLGAQHLSQAEGTATLQAHLPQPWPVVGVGRLQGDLDLRLAARQGLWQAQQLSANLSLHHPDPAWLQRLPVALRPEQLHLRIQPDAAEAHSSGLPLRVEVHSRGASELQLDARLRVADRQPWQVEIRHARLQARSAQLTLDDLFGQELAADLQFSGQLNRHRLDLQAQAGTLSAAQLQLGPTRQPWAQLGALRAELPGVRLQSGYAGGDLQLVFAGPAALQAARLQQAYLKPQGWRWQATVQGDQRQLSLRGPLSADSGLKLELQLRHAAGQPLRFEARLEELFLRAGNPLAGTLADWPPLLEIGDGRVQGTASGQFGAAQALQLSLALQTTDLGGIYDRSEFSGLTGRASLRLEQDRLSLELPDLQVRQFNPGLPLGPLRASGRYDADPERPAQGQASWQPAELGLLGGHLRLAAGQWTPSRPSPSFDLRLENLQLAELLRAYPAEGLSGTGSLDGNLPLRFSAAGVLIEGGRLTARPPGGRLGFRNARIAALARRNPNMQLVASALDDFRYSELHSAVDYDQQGMLRLALRLEGHNPNLEQGRPVHLSINLEEDIPALLTSLQLTDRVSDTIQRRVRERLQQRSVDPAPAESP